MITDDYFKSISPKSEFTLGGYLFSASEEKFYLTKLHGAIAGTTYLCTNDDFPLSLILRRDFSIESITEIKEDVYMKAKKMYEVQMKSLKILTNV